ncbi:TetR/AcrR family transcriptional regulator, partial [Fulvivirga sp. RKSG066]|uniref:TetR/AcrR family transcriptional regulator n=1 Tax=Fulvivirga aurantia TaxID=2529383 RepID=UPI001627CE32
PKVDSEAKIREAYKEHVLMHGEDPASVYAFTKNLKIEESTFYNYFSSFEAVNQAIWADFMMKTLEVLNKDKSYQEFMVREKLLSFYYTLLEVLKSDRSFVMLSFKDIKKTELSPSFLKVFKEHFHEYASSLIDEGVENSEVQDRPVIGKKYHEALWLQLLFVINFWLKDTSKQFEKTDAAVEKAVSLSFDLMGPGPLDSMIDFAKFLYHNR